MIKRKIYNKLKQSIRRTDVITILTGARQVGKTTLIRQLKEELDRQSMTTLYFNADIFNDLDKLSNQAKFVRLLNLELKSKQAVVFIDEVQRLENAGLYLKGLYDMQLPYKFIVTGSGAIDLRSKISESLAGRKQTFYMHPVSFLEFLDYKTDYKYSDQLTEYIEVYKNEAFDYLLEYLSFGSLPKTITLPSLDEKQEYVSELVNSFILRDIYELAGIKSRDILPKLLRLLANEQGKIIKYSSIATDIGTTAPTVKNYLWYLENSYVINQLTPYYRNITTELKKPTVVYFEDLGTANFLQHKFRLLEQSNELAFNFQAFIFQILRDYCEKNKFYLHYWRTSTKTEIDFVIDTVDDLIPIEVKFSHLTKPTVTRAIYSFIDHYAPKLTIIVNLSLNHRIQYKSTNIHFMSWDVFLMQFDDLVTSS